MSLTAVLVVLVPAVRELSRAARSVEKLCDTLSQELPPTLTSIRLTSAEINSLTDDVNDGVQSASRVAKQVDQSVGNVRTQAHKVQVNTRSLIAGFSAAWTSLTRHEGRERRTPKKGRPHRNEAAYSAPSRSIDPSAGNVSSTLSAASNADSIAERSTSTPQNPLPELPPGQRPEVNLSSPRPHPTVEKRHSVDGQDAPHQ